MLDFTTKLNEKNPQNCFLELPKKYSVLLDDANNFIKAKKNKEAREIIDNELENEDNGQKLLLTGYLYYSELNNKKAKESYLLAIEKGNALAPFNLALLFKKRRKIQGS
jgi:hypothetical protein